MELLGWELRRPNAVTWGLLIIGPPNYNVDDINTISFTTLLSAQIAEVKDIVFMSSRESYQQICAAHPIPPHIHSETSRLHLPSVPSCNCRAARAPRPDGRQLIIRPAARVARGVTRPAGCGRSRTASAPRRSADRRAAELAPRPALTAPEPALTTRARPPRRPP